MKILIILPIQTTTYSSGLHNFSKLHEFWPGRWRVHRRRSLCPLLDPPSDLYKKIDLYFFQFHAVLNRQTSYTVVDHSVGGLREINAGLSSTETGDFSSNRSSSTVAVGASISTPLASTDADRSCSQSPFSRVKLKRTENSPKMCSN